MTAQSKKTEQKRLDSCVLALPKWPKNRKKLRHHARVAIKASDFVADTIARVENAPENVQVRRKITLLGKYPFKQIEDTASLKIRRKTAAWDDSYLKAAIKGER